MTLTEIFALQRSQKLKWKSPLRLAYDAAVQRLKCAFSQHDWVVVVSGDNPVALNCDCCKRFQLLHSITRQITWSGL